MKKRSSSPKCRKTFSRNLPNFKISENEGYGAAPGMPRNLPKTYRKRSLAKQARVCQKTFSTNLQTSKYQDNKGYGAASGMPWNLPKHEENEAWQPRVFRKTFPQEPSKHSKYQESECYGAAPGMLRNCPKHEQNAAKHPRVCRRTFQKREENEA